MEAPNFRISVSCYECVYNTKKDDELIHCSLYEGLEGYFAVDWICDHIEPPVPVK